ncbi:hypothetical protein GEMRC1_008830 [Eukaryota sp. GEM-RC1]
MSFSGPHFLGDVNSPSPEALSPVISIPKTPLTSMYDDDDDDEPILQSDEPTTQTSFKYSSLSSSPSFLSSSYSLEALLMNLHDSDSVSAPQSSPLPTTASTAIDSELLAGFEVQISDVNDHNKKLKSDLNSLRRVNESLVLQLESYETKDYRATNVQYEIQIKNLKIQATELQSTISNLKQQLSSQSSFGMKFSKYVSLVERLTLLKSQAKEINCDCAVCRDLSTTEDGDKDDDNRDCKQSSINNCRYFSLKPKWKEQNVFKGNYVGPLQFSSRWKSGHKSNILPISRHSSLS